MNFCCLSVSTSTTCSSSLANMSQLFSLTADQGQKVICRGKPILQMYLLWQYQDLPYRILTWWTLHLLLQNLFWIDLELPWISKHQYYLNYSSTSTLSLSCQVPKQDRKNKLPLVFLHYTLRKVSETTLFLYRSLGNFL